MSFLAVVKTFPYFLFKAIGLGGLKPLFFLIFSISFNSGLCYLIYFVKISRFKFILRRPKLLPFILDIPFSEIVIESGE
jgi:hypothetical protein